MAGFLLAAFALTGSPGPNTLSLAAVGAAFGRRRGLRFMAGLSFGVVLVIVITGTGVAGLLFAIPGAAPFVTVVAAVYFLWLAYRIATAPPLGESAGGTGQPRWIAGVFQSLVNPKAYAAMAALFSGFVLIDGDPKLDGLVKAAVLVAVILCVNICWLVAGAALTPFFRHARTARIINSVFALLLILSVGAVALL